MNPSIRRRSFISQQHASDGLNTRRPMGIGSNFPPEESIVGIRETLNRNPSITTGVTIAIIVVALGAILWQARQGGIPTAKAFYTVDDGATWFVDDAGKVVPFDHKGKQAVRVYIYKCAEGKPFAGFLERYTPEAAQKLAETPKGGNVDPGINEELYMTGIEVKQPGAAGKWLGRSTPDGEKLQSEIKCPDGKNDTLETVIPE